MKKAIYFFICMFLIGIPISLALPPPEILKNGCWNSGGLWWDGCFCPMAETFDYTCWVRSPETVCSIMGGTNTDRQDQNLPSIYAEAPGVNWVCLKDGRDISSIARSDAIPGVGMFWFLFIIILAVAVYLFYVYFIQYNQFQKLTLFHRPIYKKPFRWLREKDR